MLLKKILVVVDDNRSELFEGEALTIINKGQSTASIGSSWVGPELLIIKDSEKELAVFQQWKYWRERK